MTLTRLQRVALFHVWLRTQPEPKPEPFELSRKSLYFRTAASRHSYRLLRRQAEPAFDGTGAILIPFAGMWLGIERNGYIHS